MQYNLIKLFYGKVSKMLMRAAHAVSDGAYVGLGINGKGVLLPLTMCRGQPMRWGVACFLVTGGALFVPQSEGFYLG